MDALLTDAELVAVTGAKRAKQQSEVLTRAKIYHWPRLDGTIATTWYHVNHPMISTVTEPDFEALSS